ncbi:ATP-dependent DNA helicase DDX31-like [Centroberyx affinis]|uniref:ATP-dependent DNA helicase DDX31-like n=1 Tax=Centroberyx affinis TaxID=166261 RepID=UPI003A5C7750
MMSSSGDQLCLNITSGFSSSSSSSCRRKALSAQQRWAQKKQKAMKRKSSSSGQEGEGSSSKQRREEEGGKEQQTAPPPADRQAPPTQPHAAQRQKKGEKKREREGGTETGRSGIKTSSLFKHNPHIPEVHRPVVSQLKEKIFTSDSFADLNLHPHLVATLNKVLNVSTLTSVQKQTFPALLSGRDAVVRSQTGSGKTLSYAVPVVQSLQSVQPKISRADGPLAVVIVPTREVLLYSLYIYTLYSLYIYTLY